MKESEAWHEHRVDWHTYRTGIWKHWPRFLYLVLLMTMMTFMSHGTQDMYPTFLQHERQLFAVRHGVADDDHQRRRDSRRPGVRLVFRSQPAAAAR